MEGKEDDLPALEAELVEAPHLASVHRLPPPQGHGEVDVEELVLPGVRDPEHQRGPALVGGDDGLVAEQDLREGPREAREEQPGHEREAEEARAAVAAVEAPR